MILLASILTETETKVPTLLPPIGFALIAFGIFFLLGLVTWTYRDVANRHAFKAASTHHDDHEHGSAGHQQH
jgi:hypothetical protein